LLRLPNTAGSKYIATNTPFMQTKKPSEPVKENDGNVSPSLSPEVVKKTEKKPWPMSWVIIAILLYMLFQVCYLAFKPVPKTVSMSYKYDRMLLKMDKDK
jgi:hypothetical protein